MVKQIDPFNETPSPPPSSDGALLFAALIFGLAFALAFACKVLS